MSFPVMSSRARALSVLLVALGLVAGCASNEPTSSTPAAVSPSASTPPPPPTTLLSGRQGKDGPVLAVKIDNTVNAHPQAGVMAADLVYLEEVEWGLTRLVAVYSSKYPKSVGPVRSARITDLELLPQFGKLAFAYSGANPRLLPLLAKAPFYRVSDDVSGKGYWRQSGRVAPWDLFAKPKTLLAEAPDAQTPNDVGFTFSDTPPPGGHPARSVTVPWPNSTVRFKWSGKQHRYLVWEDGRPDMSTEGPQLGGTTVIVQLADVYPSQYGDAYGGVTPMTKTVGKGQALVFRNGRVYRVAWVRQAADQGTRWMYRGKDFPMAPGQIWVALLDNARRPAVN